MTRMRARKRLAPWTTFQRVLFSFWVLRNFARGSASPKMWRMLRVTTKIGSCLPDEEEQRNINKTFYKNKGLRGRPPGHDVEGFILPLARGRVRGL